MNMMPMENGLPSSDGKAPLGDQSPFIHPAENLFLADDSDRQLTVWPNANIFDPPNASSVKRLKDGPDALAEFTAVGLVASPAITIEITKSAVLLMPLGNAFGDKIISYQPSCN